MTWNSAIVEMYKGKISEAEIRSEAQNEILQNENRFREPEFEELLRARERLCREYKFRYDDHDVDCGGADDE